MLNKSQNGRLNSFVTAGALAFSSLAFGGEDKAAANDNFVEVSKFKIVAMMQRYITKVRWFMFDKMIFYQKWRK